MSTTAGTGAGARGGDARVVVLDSVSGRVVWETLVRDAAEVGASMVGNWLTWAWLDTAGVGGWRIGSAELFEGGKQT